MSSKVAGLSHLEWKQVADIVWRWPSLGFSSPARIQPILEAVNEMAERARIMDASERCGLSADPRADNPTMGATGDSLAQMRGEGV